MRQLSGVLNFEEIYRGRMEQLTNCYICCKIFAYQHKSLYHSWKVLLVAITRLSRVMLPIKTSKKILTFPGVMLAEESGWQYPIGSYSNYFVTFQQGEIKIEHCILCLAYEGLPKGSGVCVPYQGASKDKVPPRPKGSGIPIPLRIGQYEIISFVILSYHIIQNSPHSMFHNTFLLANVIVSTFLSFANVNLFIDSVETISLCDMIFMSHVCLW